MSASFNELPDFHRFVGEKVAMGENWPTPEEVVEQWRLNHSAMPLLNEDLAALQEAIDDLENGDAGLEFEKFDRDFRARHNLPRKS
jgi:hypothetical protein